MSPRAVELGVNNRAMLAGLYDVQGYNPIHLARFDAYMRVLNGQAQEYHQTDVLESGLDSRLLDLLGVRYIVVPAETAPDEAESHVTRELPTVYADEQVKVLENARALPRAWLVHAAVRLDAQQGLAKLASGDIDPRHTVILENSARAQAAQDELLGPDPTPGESVSWEQSLLESGGDSVLLHVHAAAPGWLVLSDAYYPAWQARVDGSPRKVEIADAALRAVAVPGGDHSVEFE